jgi:hypothetical protein
LRNQQIAMMHSFAIRLNPANPDHHLWNNNGTWWCHYTVHPTPVTKQRIRASLQTKNLTLARLRRDQLLWEPEHSLASASITPTSDEIASQTTER